MNYLQIIHGVLSGDKIIQKRMKTISTIVLILSAVLVLSSCSKDISNNPLQNKAPRTFLSIFSDNQLNSVISKQTFNWWGDDPDGIVTGFIYTFNPNAQNIAAWDSADVNSDWMFTTDTQETFTLTLAGSDTVYTFWVKAIDDEGAADPEGAIQEFRIINTRPVVEFPVGTDVPETTFTVATFVWSGTDLDGDDTIAKYQYTLDDTSASDAWIDIPANENSVTLTAEDGLTQGEHVFFLRAIDLAGTSSKIIPMPQSENQIWFVKEPTSNFLIIDDYNILNNTGDFYNTIIRSIAGSADVWDIKSNGRALEPPTSLAFLKTLQLFDTVFWYGDTAPNLEKAQSSLPDYVESGGKVLMTTSFMEFSSNLGDPLDFSPADSLGSKISRITRNQIVLPTAEYSTQGFPELKVDAALIPNIFPVVPKISSETLYTLPANAARWEGTPPMAVINSAHTFVFFGLPMASLNGNGTVTQLFEIILNNVLQ